MSSSEASSSLLLRWRPAVFGLTVVAGVLGIYYVRQAEHWRDDGTTRGLHRSNAIRRRSPRLRRARASITQVQPAQEDGGTAEPAVSTNDQAGGRRESFAGNLDLPDDETTINAGDEGDGQSLLNMLYHIAVEQANREGYVHRGVTCNACNAYPIRGVRYRCANCPDYDLCEQCESLGNIHDRTHLFYKIRIPAPFLGANPRQQQPVWYPGKPHVNPRSVPNALKKQLSEITGLDRTLIDALWDQFKTLAGCDWPDDPNGLCIAIDREIWARYCVSPLMKKHTSSMALLFDRSFTFWDDNGDGLIGFEEFLQGLTVRQSRNKKEWNRRTFRAHDLDGDGYIARGDFMKLFTAHYAYCKEQSRDMARFIEDDVLEGGQLKETLQSTQAVSSCFHGSIPPSDSPRTGEGKTVNSLGDFVVTDDKGLLRQEDDGLVHSDDALTGQSAMASIFESLAQSMPDWPPDFVTAEDAHKALGRKSSLNDITEVVEQRRVLDVASHRLDPLRTNEGLDLRSAQTQAQSGNTVEGQVDYDGNYSDSPSLQTPDSHFNSIAATVEPSVTRELLYQKSAEGLHELLDPMFRQLEDLCAFHSRTGKERSRLHEQLENYRSHPMNVAMCQAWLNRTLALWRQGNTRKAWLYGNELAEDMIHRLMKESEVGSSEWMTLARDKIRSGLIDDDGVAKLIEVLRDMPSEECQGYARELQRLATSLHGGDPTPEELDQMLNDALLEDQVRDPISPKSSPGRDADIDDDLLLDEPGVITIDDSTITELLNDDARSELQNGRMAFDQGLDFAADISSRTVDQLLADAGYELAPDSEQANGRPASPADNLPGSTPRQSLAHESLSGSDGVVVGSESLGDLDELFVNQNEDLDVEASESASYFDPTLPHHRPNAIEEATAKSSTANPAAKSRPYMTWSPTHSHGTMASMEEHDPYEDAMSSYFTVKLKFLAILDLCGRSALERRGWARINEEEFEEIITGRKGSNLAHVGEWLNLANF